MPESIIWVPYESLPVKKGGPPTKDRTGERIGRLLVLGPVVPYTTPYLWCCICDCGNEVAVRSCHLKSKHSLSCGCLQRDNTSAAKLTHGRSKTRTYRIWTGMISRCTIPSASGFKYYGARGIEVCERWKMFVNFIKDMGEAPPELTIERKDTNGNYSLDNCIWATRMQQGANKRNSHLITIDGKTMHLAAWAREMNIDHRLVCYRIKCGWSEKDAITTPQSG